MYARLDNEYWGEAIYTAAYLQNRLPHASCDITPFQKWHGNKPNLSHIKIFGSKVFSYVPKQKHSKLDDKAEEGILLGYGTQHKGYRILLLKTNKVIISRSVRFLENDIIDGALPDQNEDKENCEHMEISLERLKEESAIENPDTPLRRSTRINFGIPAQRYACIANIETNEPKTWEEVQDMNKTLKKKWMQAMDEEINSLCENNTWELTNLPPNKSTVGNKWVYKLKYDQKGNVENYKARLVAKGYTQSYGQDYEEVFAPVVKYPTLRTLLVIAAKRKMVTAHMDVKSAFLNGELREDIYMEHPQGYNVPGQEEKVCRLKKCIYGLKQSARMWNIKINDVLLQNGFTRGIADPCLYIKEREDRTYILLYVDDLLICSDTNDSLKDTKDLLENTFQMKDLGEISYYLGIQIDKTKEGNYLLHQTNKINAMAKRYKMEEAKGISTPMETGFMKMVEQETEKAENEKYRQAIGELLYISTVTRPDIAASVGFLGRKVSNPTKHDWNAAKRVIKYLRSTINLKLKMGGEEDIILTTYSDADWAGDQTDRKSTSGCVHLIGNSPISWYSKKQACVVLSSTEAEYVSAATACQDIVWIRRLLMDFKYEQNGPTVINEDNQSCIRLTSNEKFSARTKHIEVKHHYLRELSENNIVELKYCPTDVMLADALTKPLPKPRHNELLDMMNFQRDFVEGGC